MNTIKLTISKIYSQMMKILHNNHKKMYLKITIVMNFIILVNLKMVRKKKMKSRLKNMMKKIMKRMKRNTKMNMKKRKIIQEMRNIFTRMKRKRRKKITQLLINMIIIIVIIRKKFLIFLMMDYNMLMLCLICTIIMKSLKMITFTKM